MYSIHCVLCHAQADNTSFDIYSGEIPSMNTTTQPVLPLGLRSDPNDYSNRLLYSIQNSEYSIRILQVHVLVQYWGYN